MRPNKENEDFNRCFNHRRYVNPLTFTKLKLCIVSSGDFFSDYGGGQVYVRNIVDEFCRRQDVSIFVISFCKDQASGTRKYKSIDVFLVNSEQSLRDTLSWTKPDIVHANGEKLLTARLCKERNIPCIVTAHHGGIVCPAGALLNSNDEICRIPADYNHCLKCYLRNTPTGLFWYPLLKRYNQNHYCRIGKTLEKLPTVPFLTPIGRTGLIVTQKIKDWQELAATATHFIAPSDAMAEALRRNGCPASKITVVPHGIPINEYQNSKFKIQNSKFIKFYYVGRINYVKGIHVLLKAFSSIDNPNIELHLIGGAGNKAEQRYQNQLKKKYRKDTRIIWHGKVPSEQMPDIINDFHCLVHPAIYLEVFGLNISEALAQNKYVITTRCGGPEMQIDDRQNGWLVAPNDVNELQNAMKNYCSEKSRSSYIERKPISIVEHVESLISIYERCRH